MFCLFLHDLSLIWKGSVTITQQDWNWNPASLLSCGSQATDGTKFDRPAIRK
jgi:hypothetical protein